MDSDDDFMSGVSSDEDNVLQDESDNDDGSADGMFDVLPHIFPLYLILTPGNRFRL
jgi:hypothetical protein